MRANLKKTTAGLLVVAAGAFGVVTLAWTASSWAAKPPKYLFQIREVKGGEGAHPDVRAYAAEAFTTDLRTRAEIVLADGAAASDAEMAAQAKKRRCRAFSVSVRLDEIAKQMKEPRPGGRLPRMEVSVKLSVFGTTIPGEKLAFSGEGEAGLESEVTERTAEAEAVSLQRDAVKAAVKQAVDQAVLKLSLPKSEPLNESKRKRAR